VQKANTTDPQKNLGAQVASYGPRIRRWREAWIWPIPGFILSFVLLITGLDWYYYGYTQYGPVAANSWSQNWLIYGILIGGLTLGLTAWQMHRSRIQVNLYRYGIDVKLPGRSNLSLRWEDISGIASATTQEQIFKHTYHTSHQITLLPTHGKPFSLDDRVDNLTELTTRLKANLYPRLLPGLKVRYQTGNLLSFGPISIQSNYISIRGKRIPWERIGRITVLEGHLVVNSQNSNPNHSQNYHVPVYQIPNLELLLQVLER
jgi:hypothetical protein